MWYYDFCEAQNERNRKTGHTERNRDPEDLLKSKKTAPEESIIQIGTMEDHIPGDVLLEITAEFFIEFSRRFGERVHILDWSLHMDEATPHIHERHVFDCENRYGEIAPQQEKALEALDIPLPFPDKPPGKNNNRKITFDAICRTILFDIAQKHDVHLEREPEYGGRAYLEKQDYILMRQKQKLDLQDRAIQMQKDVLLTQDKTIHEKQDEIKSQSQQIAGNKEKLDELTVKLNDVESLMDEVADIAYEKAVDAITAEVIIETQNQDIARLESVRKWVEDPKIKRSKAERAFGIKVLDNAAVFLRKGIDRIIAAVKKKFLKPEFKKQKTEEIKREARKSIYTYLEEARAELAEKRAMQPQHEPPAKKKQYDMDR